MSRPLKWTAAPALIVVLVLALPAVAAARGIGGVVADVPTGGHPAHAVRHGVRSRVAALDYEGGPVLHSNRTHLIFWSPAGSGLSFPSGYATLMERFLRQVASASHEPSNVYGLTGQYTDTQGPAAYASSYGGAFTSRDPLPPSDCTEPATGPAGWSVCVTDADLQQELERVVGAQHLPRRSNDVYFLVLPEGLGTCTDASSTTCALGGSATGFCGYHSQTGDGLLYAVIPYNAVAGHCQSDNPRPNGTPADPAISTLSHEHNEMITDPETYNSWIDQNGQEDGDLCITDFGPALGGSGASAYNEAIAGGHYYLQEEWSNEDGACRARDESDPVSFTAPSRARSGRAVQLVARAGDPDGHILGYDWDFGDRSRGRHRVIRHAFHRAGSFRIVLRVTDSADNWTFFARTLRVLPAAARELHHRRRAHGAPAPAGHAGRRG